MKVVLRRLKEFDLFSLQEMYLNRFPAAFCPTTRYYKGNSEAFATRFNVLNDELKLLPVVCQGEKEILFKWAAVAALWSFTFCKPRLKSASIKLRPFSFERSAAASVFHHQLYFRHLVLSSLQSSSPQSPRTHLSCPSCK